jgi:uncharacterized protein (DUF342 family)
VINPIEQFFPIEERPDGLYIKVMRGEKDSLRKEIIRNALDAAQVMNYDLDKILDIIQRGRGIFERSGPSFEYYDEEYERCVQLSVTSQKAMIKINSTCIATGRKPNEKVLVHYLKRHNIIYGIKIENIKKILAENKWDEYYDVAEITPPVDGQDAKIELNISVQPNLKPQLRNDGSVDYRDIKSFTSVIKGQLLATRFPATLGKAGVGLNGEPIFSKPGNDRPLPSGKNTEGSKDGKQLLAARTGIAYQENGMLNIVEMLHIGGNVDFSIGNVKYSGDVLINGNILPGFTIEADGTVHIKGDVESARVISRNGRVIVEKGIIGKGDTNISAKLGIQVSFAQEAVLTTEGCISFDKFLLHCDCTAETFEGYGSGSNIIGGDIKAEKSVVVRHIGTDKGVNTKIRLFDKHKAAVEEKIKELQILEKKLVNDLDPIEKQLRTKAILLKKADEVSLRQREEVKKWVDAHNVLNSKIKYVKQKIEELQNELKGPRSYDGFIFIQGNVYPGTELELYDLKHVIESTLTNKRFRIQNSGLQSEEQ